MVQFDMRKKCKARDINRSPCTAFLFFFGTELILAHAAKRAYPILGNILPLCLRRDPAVGIARHFVINIGAYIADVFHKFFLSGLFNKRQVCADRIIFASLHCRSPCFGAACLAPPFLCLYFKHKSSTVFTRTAFSAKKHGCAALF